VILSGWGGRIPEARQDAGATARAAWLMRQLKTTARRPFRVKLRGMVLILVRLPNGRQVRAALHTLSTSGGMIHLEKPLDEKIEVELLFHVDRATIRGRGQMLFPMWATQGWLQPFRFIDLPEASRKGLEANLKSFLETVGAESD
jgi:hypothetical protein